MKKSLKTLAAVVLAALTMSLTGCTKDPSDLIIGTWQAYYSEVVSTFMGQTYTSTNNYENQTSLTTFKKDGTFETSDTENGRTTTSNGTYVVKDNTLTMTFTEDNESYVESYVIAEINKNDVTLTASESGTDEGVSYSVDITFKLKKV